MAAVLIPVSYHSTRYPLHIVPAVSEVAGHFDVKAIRIKGPYCLHTEYSYRERQFSSPHLANLPVIKNAQRSGIPQLWLDDEWVVEFVSFLTNLVGDLSDPVAIELHPPFTDYSSLPLFMRRLQLFEERLRCRFPSSELLIENRCGSVYCGGRFVMTSAADLLAVASALSENGMSFRLALDFPQLLTAELKREVGQTSSSELKKVLRSLLPAMPMVRSVHLWGKRRNIKGRPVAHQGDFTSYFESRALKETFLEELAYLLNDDVPRYLVPEVNSNSTDLCSIVADLERAGIHFLPASHVGIQ